VEPDQKHIIAAAVFCDSQQVLYALEARFTGQIVGDVRKVNRRNRVDDNVTVVHRVTTTDLDVRTCPDAHAAPYSPPPDSLPKTFSEHHVEPRFHTHIRFTPAARRASAR
jgi:hypothetical protein